jgi:hypothetical protein
MHQPLSRITTKLLFILYESDVWASLVRKRVLENRVLRNVLVFGHFKNLRKWKM